MIILLLAAVFAAWGAFTAKRRGGRKLDMAQYAAGFGILGALIGLVITIVLSRTLG
ncbi:hypothetical protein [Oceaniglobus roseus]|uniref:hypothetical protein n=1 Tax=Oceaniglobus roseus TaxID=1737570 RepID=UPI0012FFF9A0|nr:hypothetical protein [Kandeliimicrobium roseum]